MLLAKPKRIRLQPLSLSATALSHVALLAPCMENETIKKAVYLFIWPESCMRAFPGSVAVQLLRPRVDPECRAARGRAVPGTNRIAIFCFILFWTAACQAAHS